MRSRFLGLPLLVGLLATASCGKDSQLVIGIVTNLAVQGQLDEVDLILNHNGVMYAPETWSIEDTHLLDFTLPGSFNLYSQGDEPPIFEVDITGLKGGQAKVFRPSSLQLEYGKTNFFRMSLVLKCETDSPDPSDKCQAGFGCVEGICKPNTVDPATLASWDPQKVQTIECDSGTGYIDTGSCSSPGGCQLLPLASEECDEGFFCQEGTCYPENPAAPRQAEYGERCNSSTETCREAGLSCTATHTGDHTRCRVDCNSDADCASRLFPDAMQAGVSGTLAHCTAAAMGTGKTCTIACDPTRPSDNQCISGTTCALVDITSPADSIGPDCVSVRAGVTRAAVGMTCTDEVGSCVPGSECFTNSKTNAKTCRAICNNPNGMCADGRMCTPVASSTMQVSTGWGVCCGVGECS